MACVKYLQENQAACVVTDKNDLRKSIQSIMNDSEMKRIYIDNALKTANKKHNIDLNAKIFKEILFDVAEKACGIR
jgi:hypothetical protein